MMWRKGVVSKGRLAREVRNRAHICDTVEDRKAQMSLAALTYHRGMALKKKYYPDTDSSF